MPISYRPYAFQATVYLINRLPTLVINNHSLYECVYIRNCLHMSYSGNLDALVFYFLGLIMPINYNITPPNVFFLGLAILTKVAFVFMSQQVISMRLGMWLIFNEFSFPFSSIVAPVSSASLPSSPHFLQHPTMPPILPTPQCSYSPQSSLTHPTSTSTPSISTSATSSTSSPTSFSHSHIPTHPLSPSQNSQMETWSTNVPIFENSSVSPFLVLAHVGPRRLDESNVHSMITRSKLVVHKPKLFIAVSGSTTGFILFESITYK